MNARCECGCGEELPPSTGRPRRWVNDTTESAAVRRRRRPSPPMSTVHSSVRYVERSSQPTRRSIRFRRPRPSRPCSWRRLWKGAVRARSRRRVSCAPCWRLWPPGSTRTMTRSSSSARRRLDLAHPGGWSGDERAAQALRTPSSRHLSGRKIPNRPTGAARAPAVDAADRHRRRRRP